MHLVYFLQSQRANRFYIGCSTDIEKRLVQHNAGYTKSTKPYRPWVLIHSEKYDTKSAAEKREWHLKHPQGYLEKKSIIAQYGSHGGFA
jgi:putative endonuclease